MFGEVMPELSQAAHVIAADLPGFGESDVLPEVSFHAFGQAISELLDRLAIGPRYIYLGLELPSFERRHVSYGRNRLQCVPSPEQSQQPRWFKIVGPIDGLHRLDKKHGMETTSYDVLSIPWAQRGHTEKSKVSV